MAPSTPKAAHKPRAVAKRPVAPPDPVEQRMMRQREFKKNAPDNHHLHSYVEEDGKLLAIFENSRGEQFLYDLYEPTGELLWVKNLGKPRQEDAYHSASQRPVERLKEKAVIPADAHSVAKAFFSLSEHEQRKYWEGFGYLGWESPEKRPNILKRIGFQVIEVNGSLGAIFVDAHDGRHLYTIDYMTGLPRRLGVPRPTKRP